MYSFILQTIILPVGNTLFGGSYLKYLREWSKNDRKSEEELNRIQINNLSTILKVAHKKVPHYKSLKISFSESPLETLKFFPILTKDILRNKIHNLISDDYDINKLDKNHSSGSSGQQSFTYMTKDHKFYLRALQTHWWQWSGYKIGSPILQFGISQKRTLIKKLKDIFYRCEYVKAFGLSNVELNRLANKLTNSNIQFIAGYPSVINQLTVSAKKNGLKPNVEGIVCFGDKLFKHHKKNISEVLGKDLKLIDTYGCAEGLLIACSYDTEFYYIMSPHVFIEIVDDSGKPVEDGTMGNILVTCLTNYAQPIIRYKLGDLGIMLPKTEYPKNRSLNYPLLKKVVGRETDVIRSAKGVILNVHSFTGVMEYYESIKQYKVVQNSLEEITIQYVVDTNYPFDKTTLEQIRTKLNDLTESGLIIHFEKCESIKASASGKPQIIESNLPKT